MGSDGLRTPLCTADSVLGRQRAAYVSIGGETEKLNATERRAPSNTDERWDVWPYADRAAHPTVSSKVVVDVARQLWAAVRRGGRSERSRAGERPRRRS
jgi:hypothetical protein